MPISIKCKLLIYTDDSALMVPGLDPKVIAEILSNELKSCRQWLIDNKLSLHLGKTESILFGTKYKLDKVNSFEVKCNNEIIINVKSVKYLGVQLDEDLAGSSIVSDLIRKVNNRLKFLYRFKDLLKFDSRKILCTALIQCHFDYSCSSWFPGINEALKNKLNIIQNKMIRFILNLDNRAHIGNQERHKAGFLSVSERVRQLNLGHVFKIKNKSCPKYMASNFKLKSEMNTRNITRATAHDFFVPGVASPADKTFFYTAINDWNTLPVCIKESKNENQFKEKVKQNLIDRAKKEDMNPFTK